MCFHKGPPGLRYALVMCMLYVYRFIGLRTICLQAKVHNLVFIICSLLVGIDCVTDKLKAAFS